MKRRIYEILAPSKHHGDLSWWFDIFLVSVICLNVIAIVLESMESVRNAFGDILWAFELFSVVLFTIEYILRVWTANEHPRYRKPFVGNIRYALTPMALIDFLAVIPYYLPLIGIDLRFLRVMRLFRLFRIFKIARYLKALNMMQAVLRERKEELGISILFTGFMLLIASTLMYYVENEAQPDKFSCIPETMWWGIATLTTVGYGDVFPITTIGKVLGGVIAVIGVGLFALPAGILASGFAEQLAHRKKSVQHCPHCGQEIGHD